MSFNANPNLLYLPVCILCLTTSVGTRIKHAAVSANDADNICVNGFSFKFASDLNKFLCTKGLHVSYDKKNIAAPIYV